MPRDGGRGYARVALTSRPGGRSRSRPRSRSCPRPRSCSRPLVEAGREALQPPGPLVPPAAFRALPQVSVERHVRYPGRRFLAVGTGGQSGTELCAAHALMVADAPGGRGA
ncbi:hypothetical protein NKH77_44985 [Streptomyces sp. M19]